MSDQTSKNDRMRGYQEGRDRHWAAATPWLAVGLVVGAILGAGAGALAWGLGVGAAIGLGLQQASSPVPESDLEPACRSK